MENTDAPIESCDCEPFVYMPAWWSSFLFQIFSPRQLAVYYYIAMLGVKDGISIPTIRQIQEDMGLASDSMVYEALRVLEDGALIRRVRLRNNGGAAQNGYRRPSCESTLVTLLQRGAIDSRLRPVVAGRAETQSADVAELAREGLQSLLGGAFGIYESAAPELRSEVLVRLLQASAARRSRDSSSQCVCALGESDDTILAPAP
jgi:hypothetical protein